MEATGSGHGPVGERGHDMTEHAVESDGRKRKGTENF